MRKRVQTCRDCRFFDYFGDVGEQGYCRRNAPRIVHVAATGTVSVVDITGEWPLTQSHMYCGEGLWPNDGDPPWSEQDYEGVED